LTLSIGWVDSGWEDPDAHIAEGRLRRRYYRLTADGRKVLAAQRSTWDAFAAAIARVTGGSHA